MLPVIFEPGLVSPEQGTRRAGAVRMDSQIGVLLTGRREMASVAELDQQAQKCGRRTSKPWATLMGQKGGPSLGPG